MRHLVLDTTALGLLVDAKPNDEATKKVQAYVAAAREENVDVVIAAAALAELYRGGHRDQGVDAWVSRNKAIKIVDTTRSLAKRIGHLLVVAGRDSRDHVDAAVIAAAVITGRTLVLTGDPDDLRRLAAPLSGAEVAAI